MKHWILVIAFVWLFGPAIYFMFAAMAGIKRQRNAVWHEEAAPISEAQWDALRARIANYEPPPRVVALEITTNETTICHFLPRWIDRA